MLRLLGCAFACLGFASLTVPACSSSEATPTGCSSEADCKTDEVCVSRQCVPIAPDSGADAPAESGQLCTGKQASPSAGLPCGCTADCDSPELCLDESGFGIPGGWCIRPCTDSACPGNLTCLQSTPGAPGTESCFIPCTQSSDCPTGHLCQNLESGGKLICMPYCQSDADCPTVGKCDRYGGTCALAPVHPNGKETGEPCNDDGECKSDFCISGMSQFPDGYCSAFCSLDKQGCPTGSFCMPIWSDIGDLGLCLTVCTDVSQCRTGYGCVGHSQFPGTKVCGPK